MIHSMTGYGAATRSSTNYKVTVELKSLNSKFLELVLKLPRVYLKYEHKVRNDLARKLKRGKVVMLLDVEILSAERRTLRINHALANRYLSELRELGDKLEMEDKIDLPFLLTLPEVIPTDLANEDPEEWSLIEAALDEATIKLIESRTHEGEALNKDLTQRREAIGEALDGVATLAPKRLDSIRQRLHQSMDDIRRKVETDQNRFEQELIYYLEKLDLNEEIVRLRQHLNYFQQMQAAEKSHGKKMHFIAQEMGREINTIGSKANHAEIQRLVVGMKDELEKIKEQVLNIV